jgi:hypothetical protein
MSKCNDKNSSWMWNDPTNVFKILMNEWNNWMEVHVVWNKICYRYGISPRPLFHPTK